MLAHGFRAMGTDVRVLAPVGSAEACAVVESLFADWEAVLSRFRPESDLSRANAGAGQPVQVDRLLLDVTAAALAAARATRGLFDPTLEHELVRIGYDRSFEHVDASCPSADTPRPGGSWNAVEIDRERSTVTVPPGCGLDLGGIAKGMAVDAALDRLAAEGVDTALVSAGGDLAVRGHLPGAVPWTIRVGDEADGFVVPLLRGALATSGTTRRRWRQGRRPSPRRRPPHRRAQPQRAAAGHRGGCDLSCCRGRRDRRAGRRAGARSTPDRGLGSRRPARRRFRPDGAGRTLATTRRDERSVTSWSAVTWDTARAGGFAAYVLLTLAVAIGLILRSRLSSERWPRVITYELHGYVSLLALVFLAIHVLAVAVDPFTHFGLCELIVPLASHYRPLWMGLGIVALYLLLAVWVTTLSVSGSGTRRGAGCMAWRSPSTRRRPCTGSARVVTRAPPGGRLST